MGKTRKDQQRRTDDRKFIDGGVNKNSNKNRDDKKLKNIFRSGNQEALKEYYNHSSNY